MKTKILVVDDEVDLELLIKQQFRRKIREGVYEFVFAHNGQQALDCLGRHPDIDIVLTDILMPVMDGLTLLTRLREANPLVKTVIISAFADMKNIRAAMNRGAFDFVGKPINFKDLELTIEKTVSHVQQMRDTLRAMRENSILRMYVDEDIINFLGHPGFENHLLVSETIPATVAFIDICGFTALGEKLSAVALVQLLNSYFDQMAKEITAQSGYIDMFLGDAVLAVFRGAHHLDRAIDAALSVRESLPNHQEALPEGMKYHPALAIGISTGEIVLGNIGSASLRRFDYTLIGEVVNLCQRLQSVAQPGQILITADTYELIKESFQCRLYQEVPIGRKASPIVTYEVVA